MILEASYIYAQPPWHRLPDVFCMMANMCSLSVSGVTSVQCILRACVQSVSSDLDRQHVHRMRPHPQASQPWTGILSLFYWPYCP